MSIIGIGILQNIFFILALVFTNLIIYSVPMEEKQKHITILSTTIIGLIILSYNASKLLIDIINKFPIGGM